jgi:Zn-dependent peptidase ImmA (M78 family)
MTTEWTTFGTPDLFEVAVRWRGDSEPRIRRPKDYGWSIGDLRIVVGSRNVTSIKRGAASQPYVSWYLFPFLEWLAGNWAALLHEEDFAWPNNTSLPAAVACPNAMERWIGTEDAQERSFYRSAQAWHRRHGLRTSAEGGLFPDLYLRRYLDNIEVSWTGAPPPFAGETFSFVAEPGTAYLSVSAVAEPLWQLLNWARDSASLALEEDKLALSAFAERVSRLAKISDDELSESYAPANVLSLARAALRKRKAEAALADLRVKAAPAIEQFSAAVAMFGGVSPNLSAPDVDALSGCLAQAYGGTDIEALTALVEDAGFPKARAPYVEGQQRALELLDELDWKAAEGLVDIRAIVAKLGINVVDAALQTDSIRGVALAGEQMTPTIIINLTSPYNQTEEGRRFSIAHELCHILFDRSHARRVAISSGPWAPAGVEKRANAFAAMLLMPSVLVSKGLKADRPFATLAALATALRVSVHALAEHAYNLGLIGESERERVRGWRH